MPAKARDSAVMIKNPSCPQGYTDDDITEILGSRKPAFSRWMFGQTAGICTGKSYHHNRKHDYNCRDLSSYLISKGYKPHADNDDFDWFCGYTGDGSYEDTECAGNPHGPVVYRTDLNRFLAGLPVTD